MVTIVARVWLPDRPGALGAVASRIGAVRGDVVGIEIIERGGGQVVDELTVELASASLVDLVEAEILQVDGVRLEEIRTVGAQGADPVMAALDALDRVTGAASSEALRAAVADYTRSDWVAAVSRDGRVVVDGTEAPDARWLAAYVTGTGSSPDARHGDDLALAALGPDLVLVVGRARPAFTFIERARFARLLAVAGGSGLGQH